MTKNRILKIFYLIIILIVIILLFVNDNGVIKYFNLRNEEQEINQKISNAEGRLKQLDSEIDSLKNSDVKIEKVARDKYRMKYPNEIPVRINKK